MVYVTLLEMNKEIADEKFGQKYVPQITASSSQTTKLLYVPTVNLTLCRWMDYI